MRKHWAVYVCWLLAAACLYFFENNTGTRVILTATLLFPLISLLSTVGPSGKDRKKEKLRRRQTVSAFVRQETEEPGDMRLYQPGDPVRRIHWKLSARKGELLVREMTAEEEIADQQVQILSTSITDQGTVLRKMLIRILTAGILLSLLLLALIPAAQHGFQALCNRVFAASEAVNAYAYTYFPVQENQTIVPAVLLLIPAAMMTVLLTVILRSRLLILGDMVLLTFFQVYFGLPFPAWINIPLYSLLAVLLIKCYAAGRTRTFAILILAISALCIVFLPGVDAATEAASEKARDHLSMIVRQFTEIATETPEGETETRHVHTQSLETGEREASPDREYRLVTMEEEQISMPHWVNYLKIILLLLLSVAVVILPFVPFLVLNARRKRAEKAREAFLSADVSLAVRAIFQQVIAWLETTDNGEGNHLYRNWTDHLPDTMPEGYASRFAVCAADFEEAAYSTHVLPEEKREQAMNLLKETEQALWQKVDWKQRFRLKYWMCLCE